MRHELCGEAIRRTALVARHPAGDVPRVHALLALLLLQASRLPARTDARGDLLLLEDQDRSLWDQRMIAYGMRELACSAQGSHLSTYHLQAGIASCHAVTPTYADTNWTRILEQYNLLVELAATPIVMLNRAVAMVHGPQAGLVELAHVATYPRIEDYYLLHATRAELLYRAAEPEQAAHSYRRALSLVTTEPERTTDH